MLYPSVLQKLHEKKPTVATNVDALDTTSETTRSTASIDIISQLLKKHPLKFCTLHPLAGRGGSVSRRDHNPKTRKRAQLAWALKSEGKFKPIPSRSSGERGLGGEGLLSEKPPLPQNFPHHMLFGRGPGGGKDSHSRRWRLSMAVFLNRNKRPSAAPIEVAEASCKEAASPGVLPRHSSTILGFSRLGRYMTKRRPMH